MFCKNGDYLGGNSISTERKFRNANFRCPKLILSARNADAEKNDKHSQPAVAPASIKDNSASPSAANAQVVTHDVGAAGKRPEDPVPHNASKISVGHQGGTVMPAPEPKTATTVLAESRVALVIGNSKYADVPLRNPIHDAEDLSKLLKRFGFNVITRTNVNQRQMEDAVNEFYRLIHNSAVALFYYSGHGTQVQGENYLIPVGENIQSESDVRFKAMNAGYVLGKMEEARTPAKIIILDACRNNPFKGVRSTSRGLTMMQAPQGSFIAYATAPNSVAQDGAGRNGVYTKYLLQELQAKAVPIELVFKNVLVGVRNETGGQQTPWVASSLTGNFFFNP